MFRQARLMLLSVVAAAAQSNLVPSITKTQSFSRSRQGGHGGIEMPPEAELLNIMFSRLILLVGGCVLCVFLVWATILHFPAYIRRLASLNNDMQRYFVPSDPYWSILKKHIIYAPVLRRRHNHEIRLSSAINFGTLPTRFQAALLIGIIAMNVTLCCITTPFGSTEEEMLTTIRNRTGTMAVVNLLPLMIMAGRNNPLIKLLDIPFDTWNLLHRWLGRIVVLETLAHVIAWMVNKVHTMGWAEVTTSFGRRGLTMNGLIATGAFTVIFLHSPSPIRHAFYEIFLHSHILLAAISFAFLWKHLNYSPSQRQYLIGAICVWAIERTARLIRLVYLNLGRNGTTATVEPLPGDALRITLRMARPWTFKPGQHLYLYLPALGLWMSHPFTAAWNDIEEAITTDKGLVVTQQDVLALQKSRISLVVRRRTGLTDKLYNRVSKNAGEPLTLRALVEGPYGSEQALDSYGTVVLFAAGVGITHLLAYVRHLVAGFTNGTVATRRVTLVWVIQSPDHLEWIKPWMTSILSLERRHEILRVMVFITRPRNTGCIHSPGDTIHMFPGRPDIGTLLDGEVENQIGAMGVLVCGTGSLSDDVRRACRERQSPTHIDFFEECFTW